MAGIVDRIRKGFNAFQDPDPDFFQGETQSYGTTMSFSPDRPRTAFSNERSIASSIYVRIAIDCATIEIKHARMDAQDRYLEDMDSGLNNCLTLEANIDQAARAFRQDIFMTLCTEGVAAIVPVDTTLDPRNSGSYDITTMRVGSIVSWFPQHVKVRVYNERNGRRQEIILPKKMVAIVQNPLYSVMNEPNSTLQRLIRKLNLLDAVDEASASGKMDLIIQLPYVIKSEARRQQAEQRRNDIEFQLKGSKYGIAYTDGTEKITQLNRPAENNLMAQIEYLTTMLYGQLGITPEIMNGTADEKVMLNYWNRTVEPVTAAVVESIKRAFLTKTARSQKQSVVSFRDPFALVPVDNIAEIADKFSRNEIMSPNEIRQAIGMRPSGDAKSDQLVNSNMPQSSLADATAAADAPDPAVQPDDSAPEDTGTDDALSQEDDPETIMNGAFDDMNSGLDDIFSGLGLDPNDDSEDDA